MQPGTVPGVRRRGWFELQLPESVRGGCGDPQRFGSASTDSLQQVQRDLFSDGLVHALAGSRFPFAWTIQRFARQQFSVELLFTVDGSYFCQLGHFLFCLSQADKSEMRTVTPTKPPLALPISQSRFASRVTVGVLSSLVGYAHEN